MPHCLHCLTEFVEGVEWCSDCGRPLSAGPLPEIKEPPISDEKFILFHTCSSDLDAELLKQLLEQNHIPVLRKGRLRGSYSGMGTAYNLPGEDVYLFVPESKLPKANKILHERLAAGLRLKQGSKKTKLRIVRLRRKKKF
ncbi:MAG: DUF2007 domain-containing protein [bacterium]|nr:DUF2007 domain-containing protein [bacterium]